VVEVIMGPDGKERERRDPVEVVSNIQLDTPVRWVGKRMPIAAVVSRFAFTRSVQLKHTDGLTYDYLHAMAKELHEGGVMTRLGGGESGKEPLIFQLNGSPYHAFLEGRVDGAKYALTIRLTNLELKQVGQ